ncbi:MAG: response regulator [Desulfohalobium sp.]
MTALESPRILLAEDDLINQKVAQKILEKFGYVVYIVQNGQEAFDCLQENAFDVVLMDVKMPVCDGLRATEMIRNSQANFQDIPIIAMTAYAQKSDREKFLSAGMTDYISKPVDKDALQTLLRKYLPGG